MYFKFKIQEMVGKPRSFPDKIIKCYKNGI